MKRHTLGLCLLLFFEGACAEQPQRAPGLAQLSPKASSGVVTPEALTEMWTPAQRSALARTRVPVLLPEASTLPRGAVFTSGEDWFAAHIPMGDVVVTMEANLTATVAPELVPPGFDPGTRQSPRMGRSELIREVSWLEQGVAWTIDISCQRPDIHPSCVEETFARDLLSSLRPVRLP